MSDIPNGFPPLEDTLREGSTLKPPDKKKPRLSLRAILREVLDQPVGTGRNRKKCARKVIEFLVTKLLLNQKIENPQIAKLIIEHVDGTPTQTIIDLSGPDDVFDGMTTEQVLEAVGVHVFDDNGVIRPKELVKKGRAKKAKKAVKRARRSAPREEEEGE